MNGGQCEDSGKPFEAILLHELMHAIHARVQIVQDILSASDYNSDYIVTNFCVSPLSQTNTKLLEVAIKFANATSVLLTKIHKCEADWGKAGYTKDYWLSDVEMVPHLATVWLAVEHKIDEGLLFGPAVELYEMWRKYSDIRTHFQDCFKVLKEMKEIPSDGLHDTITGLTRTQMNYESIGAADYPALRWRPDTPEREKVFRPMDPWE